MHHCRRPWLPLAIAIIGLAACDRAPEQQPPPSSQPKQAAEPARRDRRDVAMQMRTAQAAYRDSADGGGRAWISKGPSSIATRGIGHWTITYEAGDEGIAEGGMVVFMVSPFWGWSDPQVTQPSVMGYTTATTKAEGVTLSLTSNASPMVGIEVVGRSLRSGETVEIEYGAGSIGARADRFAESESRFWIGVDGDGDGTHRFLPQSPSVAVLPGPANRLVVFAPSTVRPGTPFTARVSALDRAGNNNVEFSGTARMSAEPAGATVPPANKSEDTTIQPVELSFSPQDRGSVAARLMAPASGAFRLRVDTGSLHAISNPVVVAPTGPRIFWADLHGHSALSDGTGTPKEYYRYARDVARLDIAALTDHDHWGVLHLDATPEMWQEIQAETALFHRPGAFVTLLGYEWTSWVSGHRHVLFFSDEGTVYSSVDERYDTPGELWSALQGSKAMTVAHHSAGGPIATDWSIRPNHEFEPLTEVVSVHGVSEAADSPAVIYNAIPGNFVRDAIARGYRFGFIGSGDSHDGHPGLAHLGSGATGGIAAVLADELTRDAVLEAMRQRRVYATSGPRIYLRMALATFPMGSVATAELLNAGKEPPSLYIHAIGTDTIRWIDIVRSGDVTRLEVGELEIEVTLPIAQPTPGEYLYVRIVQEDGGLAWSSPVYIE